MAIETSSMGILLAIPLIIGAVFGAPLLAGALVPVAMKLFGVVVMGVGTLHAAGGVAAALATFAVSPPLGVMAAAASLIAWLLS